MGQAKSLSDLGLPCAGNPRVTGITLDSRAVQPGWLFAALPGSHVHGAAYMATALAKGAGAVLTDAEGAALAAEALRAHPVPLVVAEDARAALSGAAALWFGAQPEVMVAVTGTAGKSSVTAFTRQIWQSLGHRACNIGTMGVQGDFDAPLAHTTPDALTLHRVLSEMAAAGVTHAALEASSHGLDQRRMDGVWLKAAGFTNFSQDHLDYHQTFDAYFAAKALLFDRLLPEDGTAVINTDSDRGRQMLGHAEARGQRLITVGRAREADLRITGQRYDATGQELRFTWQGRAVQTRLALIGGFQAENVLLAAGLCLATGARPDEVFSALAGLTTVPGRMQLAATRANGATVFVDYAHKPGAVAEALRSLRPHVLGRIVVVLGAGGDRDRGKRPLMGQAAAEFADVVYITDDNPRSEDPASIRAEVMAGCPGATEVGDRAEAILRGVDELGPGDALIIAGKGHETGQYINGVTYPFDDVEQASVAVAALDGRI